MVRKAADSLVQQGFRFIEAPQLDHDLGGAQPRARRIGKTRTRFGPEPKSLIMLATG